MDKYIEAEKRLAELLGWKEVRQGGRINNTSIPEHWLWGAPPDGGDVAFLPHWCRDSAAAFALMAEYIDYLALPTPKGSICAEILGEDASEHAAVLVDTKDHPDRETAVRYAIVMAVISKLEG